MKRLTLFLILAALVVSCKKNTPPVASLTLNPATGTTETLFHFDGSGSSDGESCPCKLLFRWDWESDGTWDTGWSPIAQGNHRFSLPAIYNVKLSVIDEEGLTDEAVVVVLLTAINKPPVALIKVTPDKGPPGLVFTFDAGASHDAGDPPGELMFRWDWTNDGNWDTDYSTDKKATHQYPEPGSYTVRLEVKDQHGLTDTDTVNLKVTSESGSFTDSRDGHTYKTVQIGKQIWMKENLAWLPKVSPPGYGSEWADSTRFYYVFGYEGKDPAEAMKSAAYLTYGVLYNWPAAATACPSGWHLPSDKEWTTLTTFLGDSAGLKMKEAGYDHWDKPNTGATNSSGFTALAAGHRNYDGKFHDLWIDTNFWTSTPDDSIHAWGRYLGYSYPGVSRFNYLRNYAFSVRCVKD